MKTISHLVSFLLLSLLPGTVYAEPIATDTATLTVTILPSPLDAVLLPGCEFSIEANSESSLCNATLIVADPTLSMTGWRVTLAASSLTCGCQQTLPPELLTVQAVIGPILVNGQPVDTKNGPIVESDSLGQSLKTPVPITHAQPDYGNGAYSYTLVLRLAAPDNVSPGTYIPEWVIGVSPHPN